ncbi:MAG TPA: hypothetical protein VJH03_25450 [Blastocatellia bacterium]|nr:hypothetical protein [Blastocatellia bacterium]
MWQHARDVLAEKGKSMSSREIWNRIESSGRYRGRGSNPDATLRTELARKTVGRTETWTNNNKVFYAESGNPTRWGLLEWLDKAHIPATPKATSGRILKIKDESDLETVSDALNISKKRCHNQLTNQLLKWATAAGLLVKEGSASQALYDALLIDPEAVAPQVLVEAKASCDIADVRLAIGQLLDYLRHLPNSGETELAILLPERPPQYVIEFIQHVDELIPTRSVLAIWFGADAYLEYSTDTPPPLFTRRSPRSTIPAG